MKPIKQYISEKLKINKDNIISKTEYKYFPEDKYELREMISDHILMQAGETHTSVDLSDIDVSGIDDFGHLFRGFNYLKSINVSNWDTSKVTNFENAFAELNKVTEIIGLDDWDVSNAKIMKGMFYKCKSLNELDLFGWDTKSLLNIRSMFSYCENLKSINGIENFNVLNVVDVWGAFCDCKKLKCNLSKWKFNDRKNLDASCFKMNARGITGIEF
jgi:surface protein